jgi:uncharacterized membrane protein YgcG
MMKWFRVWVVSLVFAFGAINLLGSPKVVASVDDFTINAFTADYYLSRDTEQRSTLKVVEKITAEFPQFDQNHGILRAIPESYAGHPVNLQVQTVTNSAGQGISFSTYDSNDNLVLKIGDPDRYVRGQQDYVITYTMRDVTTKRGEDSRFYWDINGNQWPQTARLVQATLHFDDSIAAQMKDEPQCFTGEFGSTAQQCVVQKTSNTIMFTTTSPLAAFQTLTVSIEFQPQTFAEYQVSWQTIATILIAFVLPPIAAIIFMVWRWYRVGRDPKGKGTIVPEYLPPKDESVLVHSGVWFENSKGVGISAQLVDLAVRGYLKIYEIAKKRPILPDTFQFEVELVRQIGDLNPEENQVVELLFDGQPEVGDRVNLNDLKNKRSAQAEKLHKATIKQLVAKQYLTRSPVRARLPYIVFGMVLIGISLFTMPYGTGLLLAGLVCCIGAIPMPARTAKGVAILEQLKGLQMYMKLAEAERIKVMQSPRGPLTPKINVNDKVQLIKLYEQLLPYAIIFAIEKQWAQEFAALYVDAPNWYSGAHGFQTAVFAQSISNLNQASAGVFASPSSDGGSGGGSAGGGGGGGGGGGW